MSHLASMMDCFFFYGDENPLNPEFSSEKQDYQFFMRKGRMGNKSFMKMGTVDRNFKPKTQVEPIFRSF